MIDEYDGQIESLSNPPLNLAENEQQDKARRSRKDIDGRDYICGCGKMYLSYPALYTHIKTKHEGVHPEGTRKTGKNNRRGRPKLDEQFPKRFLNILVKEDLQITESLSERFTGSVPLNNRIRKDTVVKQLCDVFVEMKAGNCSLKPTSSVQLLLVVYLLNVGDFVNIFLYTHFVNFVHIVRNCFHTHIQEIMATPYVALLQQEIDGKIQRNHSECRYLPVIADMLVRYYIPNHCKEVDIHVATLMMIDLCRWMHRLKLTHIKIQMKI